MRVTPGLTPITHPVLPSAQDGGARRLAPALWIDRVPRPGWLNMAIDRALLERAQGGERWLRLYAWDPPCLSFGRHEPAARRYDRGLVRALGLAAVRRPTGGRAVWHAGELTYALACPAAVLGSLREAYLEIHLVLRDAVRRLGMAAELASPAGPAPLDAGACFSGSAGGEVVAGGRKVVGSDQLREGGALLQHGSLLLEDDQAVVRQVTRGSAPPDRSAPLGRLLDRRVTWDQAAAAVDDAAGSRWGPLPRREHAPAELLQRAETHGPRFRSPEWTWDGTTGG